MDLTAEENVPNTGIEAETHVLDNKVSCSAQDRQTVSCAQGEAARSFSGISFGGNPCARGFCWHGETHQIGERRWTGSYGHRQRQVEEGAVSACGPV